MRGDSRHFGGGEGRGGGRVRRGEARYVLLDALQDEAKHGYEIIRALEERSGGEYVPSPGMVYPTLQYMEDLGWVSAEQVGERRVYALTEAGRSELAAHVTEVEAFWSAWVTPTVSAAGQAEVGFLREEVETLVQTVRNGVRLAQEQDDTQTLRRVRQAVEGCRNEIRQIIAEATGKGTSTNE